MKNFKESGMQIAILVSTGLLLAACASTDPTRVENDFGNSVRHMVNAQIYDQEAAKNPPKAPPMGMDGVQAESVLNAYHEHVGDPKEVTNALKLKISD